MFWCLKSLNISSSTEQIRKQLKKVIRLENYKDYKHYEECRKKEKEAFNVCLKKIKEHKLDMTLTDVEYKFDNSKMSYYGIIARTIIFDRELKQFISENPFVIIVSIGCGFDTRFDRLDNGQIDWYNLVYNSRVKGRVYITFSAMNRGRRMISAILIYKLLVISSGYLSNRDLAKAFI